VHPRTDAARLSAERQRVVEVLRRVGVDRDRRQVAKVDPPVERRRRDLEGLELDARTLLDKECFEDVLDALRAAETALDVCAPAARANDGEIAGLDMTDPFGVEDQRYARCEVRLADDKLAATADLDDDGVGQTLRKRRSVSPEPTAPSASPVPSKINAVSGNASAWTSGASLKPW
jgi:hypothetical protein